MQCKDLISGPGTDCYSLYISHGGKMCVTGEPTGKVQDLQSNEGAYKFYTIEACEKVLKAYKSEPNVPAVAYKKYNFDFKKRGSYTLNELLIKHRNFSNYEDEEVDEMISLLGPKFSNRREDGLAALRGLHKFTNFVREKTEQKGIYTNSKCAGCSTMVQGLANAGIGAMCDSLTDKIFGIVCDLPEGVFGSFCNVLKSSDLGETIGMLCNSVAGLATSSIVEKAAEICSELTCTSPQASSGLINELSQLTGTCDKTKNLNERCDEFLDELACARRGICIAETTIKVFEVAKDVVVNPAKAGLKALADLVVGETPEVYTAITDLTNVHDKCNGIGAAKPLIGAVLLIFMAAILL